ncbi:MAG: hypothetical protein ORN21_05625 [Methylophilaceae bacterium]|nr:hypothetical protein [Methylophilaceae bacterium]
MTQDSAIQQINLGYHDKEDRLLLRLGLADQTEVVVWLTRRVCHALWGLLEQMKSPPVDMTPAVPATDKSQALASFTREIAEQQAISNMNFQSEYESNRTSRTDVPLLAVQCALISMNHQPPQLEIQCANGQSIKLVLNNEIVHAFIGSLQIATRDIQWGLDINEHGSVSLPSVAVQKKLH